MAGELSARIGSNFSDYQGSPNLGGVNAPALQIDTRPLQDLAAYTFTYNKAQFEQRQKDMEAKAKQLADITAYDLTSAIPKDRDEIQKGYNDLFNYVQDNPTVLDYKNNEKGWMEYNKKKNEFENKLQGAKSRSVLYTVREQEVSNATDPSMKAFLQKNLDDEANSTDLSTPLNHTQLFDIAPVQVEAPPSFKLDVSNKGANFLATRTYDLPDMSSARSQASAKALGFSQNTLDENSDSFLSKTPQEQQLIRDQFKAQTASGKLEPVESANNISDVLKSPKYQDAKFRNSDGTLNIDAVIKDNANNKLVGGVLTSIQQFNNKMDEMANQIDAGYFTDKLGQQLNFGSGGLNKNDYSKIDLSDGLSPEELLTVRITGLAKAPSYTTKVDQTNEGIAKQNVAIAGGHLNETIRHNKATEFLDSKTLDSNTEKWKASQVGGTTQINGAMERAKRIYKDLLKITDKNGVITPDKIRLLNVEQLKYLGTEVPQERDANGVITTQGGFKPLSFETDTDGKIKPHAIQLVNGEIRVLKDAKPSETGSGRYLGNFDPTKSTNLYNIGTNILNEELQKAGSKELNSYIGVDLVNGATQNTEGGGISVSGSATSTQSGKMTDAEYQNFLKKNGLK